MTRSIVKSLLSGSLVFLIISFAPAYLTIIGKGLSIIGMFMGVLVSYNFWLFVIITGIISILWSLKVFLADKN